VTEASLVIFDCDGVLIDSEIPAARVLTKGLTELGLTTHIADCHARYRGRAWRDCIDDIAAQLGRPVPEEWLDGLRSAMRAAIDDGLSAMPHAAPTIDALRRAQFALCVASSSNLPYLERVLTATDLIGFFDGNIFSASMVARGKPAPDLFLHAAERMGHVPENCVVVEDSLPGVCAARAAGMSVLAYVADDYSDGERFKREGATVIHDLRDVARLVQRAA